jgi:hypothetical protein
VFLDLRVSRRAMAMVWSSFGIISISKNRFRTIVPHRRHQTVRTQFFEDDVVSSYSSGWLMTGSSVGG